MTALKKNIHLLYICHEPWPTFRADVAVLFGKYLPRFSVTCDIVTQKNNSSSSILWDGGAAILCSASSHRWWHYFIKTFHNFYTISRCDHRKYDALQVRDMPVSALFGMIAASLKRIPFFYWMSFPQSEGQIARARARGPAGGLHYWFPLIQGILGTWILYKIVLPNCTHIFVQSERMLLDVKSKGILSNKMTVVPMGVDLEVADPDMIIPAEDSRLTGKRVLLHLGTLDRARKIEMLFEVLKIVHRQEKNVILVLVGDDDDEDNRRWLKSEATRLGISDLLVWTGWLPIITAWQYVRAAEIGLSPFPRGALLDGASPTKLIEYLAFGVPAIVNDNPDQSQVVADGICGICVPWIPDAVSEAVLVLLSDPDHARLLGRNGRAFVQSHRSYEGIAKDLASTYAKILM